MNCKECIDKDRLYQKAKQKSIEENHHLQMEIKQLKERYDTTKGINEDLMKMLHKQSQVGQSKQLNVDFEKLKIENFTLREEIKNRQISYKTHSQGITNQFKNRLNILQHQNSQLRKGHQQSNYIGRQMHLLKQQHQLLSKKLYQSQKKHAQQKGRLEALLTQQQQFYQNQLQKTQDKIEQMKKQTSMYKSLLQTNHSQSNRSRYLIASQMDNRSYSPLKVNFSYAQYKQNISQIK